MANHTEERNIREQDPLKQGLKHPYNDFAKTNCGIREQDPLKQGLKPGIYGAAAENAAIREQDPLKQGLKLDVPQIKLCVKNAFVSKIH